MYSAYVGPVYDKGRKPVATLVCPVDIVVYIPCNGVPDVISNPLTVIVVCGTVESPTLKTSPP